MTTTTTNNNIVTKEKKHKGATAYNLTVTNRQLAVLIERDNRWHPCDELKYHLYKFTSQNKNAHAAIITDAVAAAVCKANPSRTLQNST